MSLPARVRGVGPETGGVMLIVAGCAFALERFTSIEGAWRWLPLFAIYLAVRDFTSAQPADRSLVPLLFTIWLQISAIELFGFDFLNSWPLLVALVGLGLLIDGIADGSRRQRALPFGDR
jgi:hypothetical protein